ncbi:hypothetical protein VQ056_15490 [Paenibacillus sp. JTLBN-2024]
MDPGQPLIVVTSNYRVSSGIVPGLREAELVLDSADENRQALIDYIAGARQSRRGTGGKLEFQPYRETGQRHLRRFARGGPIREGLPGDRAYGRTDARGYGIYRIDLAADPSETSMPAGPKPVRQQHTKSDGLRRFSYLP